MRRKIPKADYRGRITAAILTALLFCVTTNAQEQAKLTASDACPWTRHGRCRRGKPNGDGVLDSVDICLGFDDTVDTDSWRSGRELDAQERKAARGWSKAQAADRFFLGLATIAEWCPTMGKKRISQTLARAGLVLGVSTVGRMSQRNLRNSLSVDLCRRRTTSRSSTSAES